VILDQLKELQMIDVFTVENGKVVLNLNCLLVPELKIVSEKYKGDLNPFTFIHYMTHADSPYKEYEEAAKIQLLYKEYPGKYKVTDLEIINAIDRLKAFYDSDTILRLYNSVKVLADKMAIYAETMIITDSKDDSNVQHGMRLLEKITPIMRQLRDARAIRDEEINKTRGKVELSYDQQ
jgi:hypothetical protein